MVKTLAPEKRPAKLKPRTVASPRQREADEFEADTQEDRTIAVLAEKRRRFLGSLGEQKTGSAE